jgi:hypothetical protein
LKKHWEIIAANLKTKRLRFFELAFVLVRFDHVASRIVNANHSIMSKWLFVLDIESWL